MASIGLLGVSSRFNTKRRSPAELQELYDNYTYRRRADTGQMDWVPNPGSYGEVTPAMRQPISNLKQTVTGNIDSFELGGDFQQTTPGKGKYKFKYYSVVWFWASSKGNYDIRVEAGLYYYVREEEQYDVSLAEAMLSNAMKRSNWLNGASNVYSPDVSRVTSDGTNFPNSSVRASDSQYRAGGFFGRSEEDISLVEFNRPQFVLTYKDRKVEEFALNRNLYKYLKF